MTLFFTGDKNYLKRDSSSGQTTISAPNVLIGSGNYQSSYIVNHNLGYIPLVRVYYDPYDSGNIFSPTGDRVANFESYANGISCAYSLTTTTLTIYLTSFPASVGTVPIYWVVYLDNAA